MPKMMRGVQVSKPGGAFELVEREIPEPASGQIRIQVEACGICHTDLKKIEYDLLAPPRIYGHETAGVVAQIGEGVRNFTVGDRVVVFHHIPCMACFYCRRNVNRCGIHRHDQRCLPDEGNKLFQ